MDSEIKAYRSRWRAVEEIENKELVNSSLELRWQQLNAVVGIAIGLGIYSSREDEIEVYKRWALLKEKAASHWSAA